MHNLTPADHALLRHLKREEERCHNAHLRTDENQPNIKQDLWRARKELKDFVRSLRMEGKKI